MAMSSSAAGGHRLPERVRRRVRLQQEQGEVMVGWAQLAVVTVFGTLYAVSPKTFPADAGIEPVPWALAGFLAFTVLRLWLALRRRQPGWFRMASPVVDVAMLLVLIWSFHIQYQEPLGFVLKAPTLLYVFIFIALRVLLLDPVYVVITGVAAAFGWLALASLAAFAGGGDMITRDYVEYVTSNRVLLGAEFDKVVSILAVTGIIALAMLRARRLLVDSVVEGMRAHDFARFFAPEVADQIVHAETEIAPGTGQGRDAAMLFIDVRGFTELAASESPDAVIGLLGDYQAQLMPAIHANGGTAEKFLGDGMMAAFGAAVERESYAADALRAVEDILANVARWNAERTADGRSPIHIGLAVTAGRVVFGAVGGESRLEIAVVGHPVNLAAKIEKLNKTLSTRALCTIDTYRAALAQGWRPGREVEELGSHEVPGVPEPVEVVCLAR
jgi:adenylate cyclase